MLHQRALERLHHGYLRSYTSMTCYKQTNKKLFDALLETYNEEHEDREFAEAVEQFKDYYTINSDQEKAAFMAAFIAL